MKRVSGTGPLSHGQLPVQLARGVGGLSPGQVQHQLVLHFEYPPVREAPHPSLWRRHG